jgi:hypothetical protein
MSVVENCKRMNQKPTVDFCVTQVTWALPELGITYYRWYNATACSCPKKKIN